MADDEDMQTDIQYMKVVRKPTCTVVVAPTFVPTPPNPVVEPPKGVRAVLVGLFWNIPGDAPKAPPVAGVPKVEVAGAPNIPPEVAGAPNVVLVEAPNTPPVVAAPNGVVVGVPKVPAVAGAPKAPPVAGAPKVVVLPNAVPVAGAPKPPLIDVDPKPPVEGPAVDPKPPKPVDVAWAVDPKTPVLDGESEPNGFAVAPNVVVGVPKPFDEKDEIK
jgi:hypothetical protein